ncbi:hypothetical protein D3C84_593490 [compost metagenome]
MTRTRRLFIAQLKLEAKFRLQIIECPDFIYHNIGHILCIGIAIPRSFLRKAFEL